MTPKRKKVQDHILDVYKRLDKSGFNHKLYEKFFASLSDKEFHLFMEKIRKGEYPPIIANDEAKFTLENTISVGKSLGIKFFQKIYKHDANGTEYLTPVEYPVYLLPVRRAAQTAAKGISVPENNIRRNNLTGQVTGPSQVTKLTLPEIQVLNGIGAKQILKEFYKLHGGDEQATNIMVRQLINTGKTRGKDIAPFSSGTKSTKTLKAYFKAAMIKMD